MIWIWLKLHAHSHWKWRWHSSKCVSRRVWSNRIALHILSVLRWQLVIYVFLRQMKHFNHAHKNKRKWKAQDKIIDIVQYLTFLQVSDIKVMHYMVQNFLHVTGNRDVSVRNECGNEKTIANQILHALFKSKKFHCSTATSLISLRTTCKKEIW